MNFSFDSILNVLNTAKEKGKEFAGVAMEKGKEFADAAKEKGKDASRMAKLRMEKATEAENLKKAYTELGKAYFEEKRGEADGVFAQLCGEIDAGKERLEAIEAEFAELKESLGLNFEAPAEDSEFEQVVSEDEAAEGIEVEITEEPIEAPEE